MTSSLGLRSLLFLYFPGSFLSDRKYSGCNIYGFVLNDAEVLLTDGATFRNELKGWNLLVILDEFMALILHIGNYFDEFGL